MLASASRKRWLLSIHSLPKERGFIYGSDEVTTTGRRFSVLRDCANFVTVIDAMRGILRLWNKLVTQSRMVVQFAKSGEAGQFSGR